MVPHVAVSLWIFCEGFGHPPPYATEHKATNPKIDKGLFEKKSKKTNYTRLHLKKFHMGNW